MGSFKEEIALVNAGDKVRVEVGMLREVRELRVDAVVGTGAAALIINEETRRQLGLTIEGKRRTTFANGGQEECGRTEPVSIRWKDRSCNCSAVVIPGAKSILLGAIPLEDMDLLVDPVNQRLIGAHGDVPEALAL